jgi:hypothetical protein
MRVAVKRWEKNKGAVSVHYGPLAFSLKIGERWTRYGGTDAWPEYEVFAATPWNYGLQLAGSNPAKSISVSKKRGPVAANPFTQDTAPIELQVKARKIPGWQLDRYGLAGQLQEGPVKSSEPSETVTLIPMGAARLRVSMFPVIGSGADAKEWRASE